METLNILLDGSLAAGDYIGFTFFTGYMSMLAASIFFIVERGTVNDKWKTSLLISALITFIAAVHYFYMRGVRYLARVALHGPDGRRTGQGHFVDHGESVTGVERNVLELLRLEVGGHTVIIGTGEGRREQSAADAVPLDERVRSEQEQVPVRFMGVDLVDLGQQGQPFAPVLTGHQ